MVTFILPGYSSHNKAWAEEVAGNLTVEGEIRPIFWSHWTDPENHLKPKEKAILIGRHAKGRKINVIAKSVGTLVAAYVVKNFPDIINRVILCGIPSTSEERQKIFTEAFANFPADRIRIYQNEGDPFKSPEEIKEFLSKINPRIEVIAKPRSDHDYPYYEEFNTYLTS